MSTAAPVKWTCHLPWSWSDERGRRSYGDLGGACNSCYCPLPRSSRLGLSGDERLRPTAHYDAGSPRQRFDSKPEVAGSMSPRTYTCMRTLPCMLRDMARELDDR